MRVTVVGGRPVFIYGRPEEDEDEPDEDEPDEDESPSTKTHTNGAGSSHTDTSNTHTTPTTTTNTATNTGTVSESSVTGSTDSSSHSSSNSLSGTTTSSSSSSSSSSSGVAEATGINPVIGRAVGGVLGGIVLLVIFVYALLHIRRSALNKRRKPSGGTAEGFHSNLWNQSKHLPDIPDSEAAVLVASPPLRRKTMREIAQDMHVPGIFTGRSRARRLTIDGHREPRRHSDSHVTVPLLDDETPSPPDIAPASSEPLRVRDVLTETRNEKGARFVALNVVEEDNEGPSHEVQQQEHVFSDSESLGRRLSHRQAEFVHQLYNNDVPAPAVAEVIERMLSRTGPSGSETPSPQVAQEPPPYETGKS